MLRTGAVFPWPGIGRLDTSSICSPIDIEFQLRSDLNGTTADSENGLGWIGDRGSFSRARSFGGALAGAPASAGRRYGRLPYHGWSAFRNPVLRVVLPGEKLLRAVCDHAHIVPTVDAFASQANALLLRHWTAPTVEADPKAKPKPHQDAIRMDWGTEFVWANPCTHPAKA